MNDLAGGRVNRVMGSSTISPGSDFYSSISRLNSAALRVAARALAVSSAAAAVVITIDLCIRRIQYLWSSEPLTDRCGQVQGSIRGTKPISLVATASCVALMAILEQKSNRCCTPRFN